MTTKNKLAHAWDQLKKLGANIDKLSHHELNLELVEIEQHIAEARRLIMVGGHAPIYAIGIEISDGEFGFTHGPTPDLKELLTVIPFGNEVEKNHILRFEADVPFVDFVWSGTQEQWIREA
jgi:hypothetical protein